LDSSTDWVCMCCHLHISSDPPSLSRSDWSIVKPSIGKRPNSNNIFFSKGNTSRLKSISQSVDQSQSSRTDQIDIDIKHNVQSYATSLKSSPNGDLSKTPFAASGKSAKHIRKECLKDRESRAASAAITKESRTVPAAVRSPTIDLPYLDDFDDTSSTEENNNEGIKAAIETDNDEDCNLILTLTNPRNTVSKRSKNSTENSNPRKMDCQKKRRASGSKVPEISSPSLVVVPFSCTKKKRNSRQKCAVPDDISASDGAILPPVNTAVDEVYYFSQYVQVSQHLIFPMILLLCASHDCCNVHT
jgi:hypothetical protein